MAYDDWNSDQLAELLKARGIDADTGEAIKKDAQPSEEASPAAAPEQPKSDEGMFAHGDTSDSLGFMSHPIDNTMKGVHAAQDLAGGFAGGAQRLGSFIGEGAEKLAHAGYEKATGNKVPHYNAREAFGLEGPNKWDAREKISHDPNSFMSMMGGALPAIEKGGLSLLPKAKGGLQAGQALAQGLWGTTQADPDQQNLGGWLPKGRVGAGIQDAGATLALGGLAKYGPKVVVKGAEKLGEWMNWLRPNKDAGKFLNTLGQGTQEENKDMLAGMIQKKHDANLADSLSHKTPIYEKESANHIYKTPESKLPEGNIDVISKYIQPGEKLALKDRRAIEESISDFREHGDMDILNEDFEDIFKKKLNKSQKENLETAFSGKTEHLNRFDKVAAKHPDAIEGNTKELVKKYRNNPSLDNADKLQTQLGDDWGDYEDKRLKKTLEPALKPRLQQLTELRGGLKKDIAQFLKRQDKSYPGEIKKFATKYKENVVPFGEEAATRKIVKESRRVRAERAADPSRPYDVSSSELSKLFSEPNANALKIASDIGPEGQKKMLYHLFSGEGKPNAVEMANNIIKAKQSGGYGRYISDDMVKMAESFLKRARWGSRAGYAGKVAATAVVGRGFYDTVGKFI